jgi:hypothetical protein
MLHLPALGITKQIEKVFRALQKINLVVRGLYGEGSRASGDLRLLTIKYDSLTVRIYGDVALVKGVCDFRNGQPGNLLDNHLNILWVMVKRAQGPYGWQIVARQTTRIGPSTGTPVSAKKP